MRRRSRDDDKFTWNPEALAVPPLLDQVHIAGAHPRPNLIAETRPGQRDRAADEGGNAGLIGVGVGQGRSYAMQFNGLELCIGTKTRERVLLTQALAARGRPRSSSSSRMRASSCAWPRAVTSLVCALTARSDTRRPRVRFPVEGAAHLAALAGRLGKPAAWGTMRVANVSKNCSSVGSTFIRIAD